MNKERRFIAMDVAELRADDEKIRGYAAVFNKLSDPMLGGMREVIAPGAFEKALPRSDIRALWNHNPDFVLGRSKNGTLEVIEDERGLSVAIDPPNTSFARDAVESIRRGDVNQMSFMFTVAKNGDEWTEENGKVLRTVRQFDRIYDVSPVTFPAYPQTSVQMRELVDAAFDVDQLAGLLLKAEKVGLTSDEQVIVRSAIQVLSGYVEGGQVADDDADTDESDAADELAATHADYRSRIEAADKILQGNNQ